ncbi:TldD/PmbA family protein [Methanotorris formicicus]|uniref:Peptidase U62 modulator of DNA gyrase n=1 Tax=Methanotorris formicicus Mc-S-70 TaxID=647171 RepID=H1KXY5_9EURY|nr:TldD/PmbA family protein [Methanotorris formicicus]EHP87769.1 peptidase U62 modulator of DNA gyrase [Methanotorris formicicus Mc-S-70]
MDIIEKIMNIGEKEGFEVEIFISKGISSSIDLDGESVDSVELSKDFGIGVRVIKNSKIGFAYSKKEDTEVVYKAMKNLVEDKFVSFAEKEKFKEPKGIFYKDVLELSEEEMLGDLILMRDIAKDEGVIVTGGGVSKSYEYNRIVNSNGVDVEEEFTYYSAYLSVIYENETGYEGLTKTKIFDVENIAKKSVELAKKSANGKTITYEGEIMLSPRALSSLLAYTLIPSFSAENVQRNRSVLKDKLGEEVFGENITIIDDGTLDNANHSSKVDGEGCPTKRTVLVENGVLKSYLYDIKRANIEDRDCTGNGMRGYSSLPYISPSNFIIESVDKLENFDNYVYVNGVIGSHTSNPITGDFVVEVQNAFMVKNGEEIPIKKGLLSGNIFECLKEAIPLDDVEQRGRLISPSLVIKGHIVG